MKKISLQNFLIVAVLLLCTFISTISGYSYAASKPSYQGYMNAYQRGVYLNSTVQLGLTGKYRYSNVSWKSDNTNIATVNSKGLVRGLKYNSSTYVRAYYNNKQIGACKIIVKGPAYQGYMNTYQRSAPIDKLYKLDLTKYFKNVQWKSDDTNIVKVDQNGYFQGIIPNKSTYIRAFSNGKQIGACKIFTKNPTFQGAMKDYQRSLYIDGYNTYGKIIIYLNNTYSNKNINWSLNVDSKTAVINKNGVLTGYVPGRSVWVTAKYNNKIIGKCLVYIKCRNLPEGVGLTSYSNYWSGYTMLNYAKDIKNYVTKNGFNQVSSGYDDACLGFAFAYAGAINKSGDLSLVSGTISDTVINNGDGGVYKNMILTGDNQSIVKTIYDELSNGKACVIQVVGERNTDGTPKSRHYVTAIGYKKEKTRDTIKDTDILILDTWDSTIKTLTAENATSGRSLFNQIAHHGYGYPYLVYQCR